jgi:hypothetical protein
VRRGRRGGDRYVSKTFAPGYASINSRQ